MESVPRKSSNKLGGGELQSGDEKALWDARRRYLDAVREVQPEVLSELGDIPFDRYLAAKEAHGNGILSNWPTLLSLADDDDYGPLVAPLRDAVEVWGKRWRLTDEWCLTHALRTLAFWAEQDPFWVARDPGSPPPRDWMPIDPAGSLASRWTEREITFTHPGWEPSSDTKKDAREVIEVAFKKYLDAYFARMTALAESRGFDDPENYGKHWQDLHFEWLARKQVSRWSHNKIAATYKKDRSTVGDGIDTAERLVGITKAKANSAGRPENAVDREAARFIRAAKRGSGDRIIGGLAALPPFPVFICF